MSGPAQEAYRKTAVERFAALDDLDHLFEVSPPRHWLALAAVSLLLGAALAWGTWGSVETRVRGRGLLAGAGAVLYLSAAEAGRVRPGMPARVTLPAAPGAALSGRVAAIATCAVADALPAPGTTVPVCIDLGRRAAATSEGAGMVVGSVTVRRERPLSFAVPRVGGGTP